jgi:hypothetical protein
MMAVFEGLESIESSQRRSFSTNRRAFFDHPISVVWRAVSRPEDPSAGGLFSLKAPVIV